MSMVALALTGCGMGTMTHSTGGTLSVHGMVHGGQQPVAGSVIGLYTVGKNGVPSHSMLNRVVTTAGDGSFNIGGDYTCGSTGDQVYLVAVGGNPGLAPLTDNPALVMVNAFGSCGDLEAAPFVEINEVTTVAAAWALAPFITTYLDIGSTGTNIKGIASAFSNAQILADRGFGTAATLPANLSIETDKLYALADALAPCVNSDGTTGCATLFKAATPAGGIPPTTTFKAALNIVRNPGNKVADVFAALNAQRPFPTAYTTAPNDWTMSLTITGGGMNSPGALAVDGFNNVWVASYDGPLSAFTPQGTSLSAKGYGIGTLNEVYGLAIDPNNNIWVTNEEQPHHGTRGSVSAFVGDYSTSVGSLLNGTAYIYDSSIDYPYAVAADTNGDILIANYGNSTATIYDDTGSLISGGVGVNNLSGPVAIAPDLTHGIWVADNADDSVTHLSSTGTLIADVNCCQGANGIATDSSGHAWVANQHGLGGGSVSELESNGAVVVADATGGGIDQNAPGGIAIDANQNVWTANFYGNNISELAGNAGTSAAGTAISPESGYGLDANLLLPYAIAPDAAGNLWVSNFGCVLNKPCTLTMFFGLAAPTRTPLLPSPTAP